MSMKQIETLVFDYGGVIVNIDDASVVKAMESSLSSQPSVMQISSFRREVRMKRVSVSFVAM